jgi:hypothetical protein
MEVPFTPNRTGAWMFRTSDNGTSDPYLEILDSRGNYVAHDDDGGGGYNALIIAVLNAGETYNIHAGFFGSGTGSYTLTVLPAPMIPDGGGVVRVDNHMRFAFVPNLSGFWELRTFDNGDSDPYLEIYDSHGFYLAGDDDSGGNLNALISIYLNAGEMYVIAAGFFSDYDTGSYTLSVEPAGSASGSSQPPPVSDFWISGDGGELLIPRHVEVEFTPNVPGYWIFFTFDNDGSDPYLELHDMYGNWITDDDDSGGYLNAFMVANLDAGVTYYINARFFGYGTGSYMLSVAPAVPINSEGGTVRVDRPTGFGIRPARSGTWEFRTENNAGSDPVLHVYDVYGYELAFDDDSGGMLNSLIRIHLNAGEVYFIYAGFFSFFEGMGGYDLVVTTR